MSAAFAMSLLVMASEAQAAEQVSDAATEELICLDTLYVLEVTASRVSRPVELLAIRSTEHAAGPEIDAQISLIETPGEPARRSLIETSGETARRWVWMAAGAGAAVAGYVWLSGGPRGEPRRGTLRVSVDGLPD
jgi:hypothetical protein